MGTRVIFLTSFSLGVVALSLGSVASASPGSFGVFERERPKQELVPDAEVTRIDKALHEQVKNALYNIIIYNRPEAIVLEGRVDSEATRERILSVTRSVASKTVRDELRVRPQYSDDQIATQARETLASTYPNLSPNVQLDVREGIVYLSGSLSTHREVDAILSTVMMIDGVQNVQSDITLGGRPYTRRHVRSRAHKY